MAALTAGPLGHEALRASSSVPAGYLLVNPVRYQEPTKPQAR